MHEREGSCIKSFASSFVPNTFLPEFASSSLIKVLKVLVKMRGQLFAVILLVLGIFSSLAVAIYSSEDGSVRDVLAQHIDDDDDEDDEGVSSQQYHYHRRGIYEDGEASSSSPDLTSYLGVDKRELFKDFMKLQEEIVSADNAPNPDDALLPYDPDY